MRGRELLFLLNFLAVPTQHMELPQSGIEPTPPAVEIQNLNPWTTREVFFFFLSKHFFGKIFKKRTESESWDNQEIIMSKKFCFLKIFIYLALPGLSYSMLELHCGRWDL